jgi:predicted nucleic acid-binding protein
VGTVILDSSLVIAIFDPKDCHHEATLARLRDHRAAGRGFTIPASVLGEVLVGAARDSHRAAESRRADLRRLFGQVRVIDEPVAASAAQLRAKHRSLRLPDALVIATGIVDEADVILTADQRWASVDRRVEVLTPGP